MERQYHIEADSASLSELQFIFRHWNKDAVDKQPYQPGP